MAGYCLLDLSIPRLQLDELHAGALYGQRRDVRRRAPRAGQAGFGPAYKILQMEVGLGEFGMKARDWTGVNQRHWSCPTPKT